MQLDPFLCSQSAAGDAIKHQTTYNYSKFNTTHAVLHSTTSEQKAEILIRYKRLLIYIFVYIWIYAYIIVFCTDAVHFSLYIIIWYLISG